MEHVLILGGYGATGRTLARLLLERTGLRVTLAGRDPARAAAAAGALADCGAGRVDWQVADAASGESLGGVLRGVDLLVVASSTVIHTQTVARAALRAGADYYDILYSPAKLGVLRDLEPEIGHAGRCFITDGGLHPGLPAVLVRRAAQELDVLESAVTGSMIQQDWRAVLSQETLAEFLDMLTETDMSLVADDLWLPRLREPAVRRRVEFGAPFGMRSCYAIALEELHSLQEHYPELRSTAFYMGGFSALVDWGVIPLALLGQRFAPQRSRPWLARLLGVGLRRGSSPPFRTVLKLEATGRRGGRPARLHLEVGHEDGYYLAAACVYACLRQLLDGSGRRPGVWLQAEAVEPRRMLAELATVGVDVVQSWPERETASA